MKSLFSTAAQPFLLLMIECTYGVGTLINNMYLFCNECMELGHAVRLEEVNYVV